MFQPVATRKAAAARPDLAESRPGGPISAAIEAGEKVRQRKEKRGYRALADTKNTDNNPTQ